MRKQHFFTLLVEFIATLILYLGHSSVKETLDTYSHFFPNETDVVAEEMNKIL